MLGRNKNRNNQWRPTPTLQFRPTDNYYIEKENLHQKNINMPNTLKPRPLISPKRQVTDRQSQQVASRLSVQAKTDRYGGATMTERSNGRLCLNHPTKTAEYMVIVDEGDEELYCGRCAAQLATQGFDVQRLEEGSMKLSKKNSLPYFPQFNDEPVYQQILDTLKLCNVVIGEHNTSIERFVGLQEHYQQQIDITTVFYDRLISIIEEMKHDHLQDLIQDKDKYTQIADISNDYLRENIIQINVIKNDIENHLEEVLEEIKATGQRDQCRESLQHYRQKLTLFRHQSQEQLESLKDVPTYSEEKIEIMTDKFERFLEVLWDEEAEKVEGQVPPPIRSPKTQQNAMTVKNIHQILPRGVNTENCEGKKAFRNLQEDEEQSFQDRKSPNFKKI